MSRIYPSEIDVMRHALSLAARGIGRVEPNPPVGAVIVDEHLHEWGSGYHEQYGGPHAEVQALAAAGERARGATLFCTLEPCCHFGKTPPCSRAVIAAGIQRVVIAMSDPAPHVAGGGIEELRAAGVTVEVGLLESAARELTAPFVQLMTRQRPWVHAKWAMTLDGKIASRTGHSQWISNAQSRAVVHQLRGRMDAIVAGIGTVLADDPSLTARPSGPRLATRVVIDSHARLPLSSQLVRTARDTPVLCVVSTDASVEAIHMLQAAGVEVFQAPVDAAGHPVVGEWLAELARRKMTHVLVEGGGTLLGSLFDAKAIDEVHAFIAPKLVGGATATSPLQGLGLSTIPEQGLRVLETQILDGDLYIHGRTRSP